MTTEPPPRRINSGVEFRRFPHPNPILLTARKSGVELELLFVGRGNLSSVGAMLMRRSLH
ncbi:MAG: hypothetical protein Q8P59_02565 [Dehalococcoidia bacterium]|nr:hypothetical protein [Dehalococcoidia bacterium]